MRDFNTRTHFTYVVEFELSRILRVSSLRTPVQLELIGITALSAPSLAQQLCVLVVFTQHLK